MIPAQSITYPAGTVLWVALGGAIGSVLRFAVAEGSRRLLLWVALPWPTLLVNIVGSFALGLVLRWAVTTDATPQVRAFLMIGVCGGFTTFSAFSLETAGMLHANQFGRAAGYAVASVLLSVAAVYAGYAAIAPRS
jgi:CrcB protein